MVMPHDDIIEMQAIFKGNVQGVGFRATIFKIANKLDLKGTVKNLHDGDVEVYAQGSQKIIEKFLEELNQIFDSKYIKSSEIKYYAPLVLFSSFKIIR